VTPSSCSQPFLPAPLDGVCSESMAFALSDDFIRDATLFTDQTVASWALPAVRIIAAETTTELVSWLLAHDPSSVVRLAVTWDAPLVHIELFDRGQWLPDPYGFCMDAAFAVHLLIRPGVQWGAGVDARGRCLWATVSVPGQDGLPPASPTEAGP
jgi:hypothetical protein